MKYALRRQEIAMCSPEYVTEHILKSLNSYFGKQDNKRIMDDISQEKYVSPYGGYYSLLRINDLADDNDMLEFAVIDVYKRQLLLCPHKCRRKPEYSCRHVG